MTSDDEAASRLRRDIAQASNASPVFIDLMERFDAHYAVMNDYAKRTLQATIDAGRVLLEAKETLPHGQFSRFIHTAVPCSVRQAERLMGIARHPILAESDQWAHLPAALHALVALAKIPPEPLEEAIRTGAVTSQTSVREARSLIWKIAERVPGTRVKGEPSHVELLPSDKTPAPAPPPAQEHAQEGVWLPPAKTSPTPPPPPAPVRVLDGESRREEATTPPPPPMQASDEELERWRDLQRAAQALRAWPDITSDDVDWLDEVLAGIGERLARRGP